jgi:hypothetical protein
VHFINVIGILFLSSRIQDLRKVGILQRINNNYSLRIPEDILQESPISVTIETVSVYFVLLAAGILISTVLLTVEIRRRRR